MHRKQAGSAFPRVRTGTIESAPTEYCAWNRVPACVVGRGLALTALLSSGILFAQESDTDGEDIAASDPQSVEFIESGEQLEAPVYVPFEDPHGDYLDAIDQIEADYGPYATELADLYLGLGQSFLDAEEYEAARDAFHRGVLSVRVNSGPNSPEQTNHLYLIANIETILGEREAADKTLKNIHFINMSYYGEDNAELLPVLERLHDWYVTTRPPGTEYARYSDYEMTIELSEDMVAVSENVYGANDPRTAKAYRMLGDAHFQILRNLQADDSELTLDSFVPMTPGMLQNEGIDDMSLRKHFNSGRSAFNQYLDSLKANQEVSPLERAEALASVGDWNLMFEKYRSAREYYEEAYNLLVASGHTEEEADSFMAEPRPVHFMDREVFHLDEMPEHAQDISLDISMTVTRLGDVRSVEFLNPPPEMTEDHLWRIKRHLRDTPFRPALKKGEVVTTKGFIWQFVLEPQEQTS